MEKYYTQIVGTPVVTEHGEYLNRIINLAINTDTGKVVGFLMAPSGQTVVSPYDVIAWDSSLTITDREAIVPIEEIRQVEDSIAKGINVYGNRVYTKDGDYLGKVSNYAIHVKFLTLTKIIVVKKLFGIIRTGRHLINSKDIIQIKKDAIIVRNMAETSPLKVKKLSTDLAAT